MAAISRSIRRPMAEKLPIACVNSTLILSSATSVWPVMDGLELAKINQEQKTPAHMILLSGYEDFHYAQSAIKYGVSDYLLKPLNREELALAVQKQNWPCQRQPPAAKDLFAVPGTFRCLPVVDRAKSDRGDRAPGEPAVAAILQDLL